MNLFHSGQYGKIIRAIVGKSAQNPTILDIGCGGGNAIAIFRSALSEARIHGIDHSADMVALAKRVNRADIADGTIEIKEGDAERLPYSDGSFDIVTAFDTINFWDDIDAALREIYRVLKRNGCFYIVNAYPREGTKWWEFAKFRDEGAYRLALGKLFQTINIDFMKNTIIVWASK